MYLAISTLLLVAQAAISLAEDPPEITMETCMRHVDRHRTHQILFYSTIEYDIDDLKRRNLPPWFSNLRMSEKLIDPEFTEEYRKEVRRATGYGPNYRNVGDLIAERKYDKTMQKFRIECFKAVATLAHDTAHWLTDTPDGTGLSISREGSHSFFAMFQFPLLCASNRVTTFYRINMKRNGQLEREDISHLVEEMRRSGSCPTPQPSVNFQAQDLHGRQT